MKHSLIYIFILSGSITNFLPTAWGQATTDCHCDLTITKSGKYFNQETSVKPGQTVCILAGHYTGLYFTNYVGTSEKPIRFINCGGQVTINSDKTPTGLQFYGCQYFIVSGTGSSNYKYGIFIEKTTTGQALGVEIKVQIVN